MPDPHGAVLAKYEKTEERVFKLEKITFNVTGSSRLCQAVVSYMSPATTHTNVPRREERKFLVDSRILQDVLGMLTCELSTQEAHEERDD